ncbi:putative eIF-2B/eIF-5 [Cafeteria roenbergensis virus]|uniref:Putative eIF-2B/eIF-5 n=1 Tax=Cafeteria roenbergensis virus (strain BV-PW1) TaxID=693272 RepID=E3T4H3_CROVB|nr:putative eIF-2B/eIF-5 [Cafeteria roenbergensis virus BV-PW1]ADO67086.1 putative eIF-2B/eIF-5 [Cafeteria roenbergensis virus BV-PW1]
MSYLDFNSMLNNLYTKFGDSSFENVFYLPEPKISKKSTRIDWININVFLKSVNRSIEHFINYLKNDRKISTTYQNNILIIQGKYRKEDINKMMLEYVNKFCKCPICSSYDTLLVKDGTIRKEKIICSKCKSTTFCS